MEFDPKADHLPFHDRYPGQGERPWETEASPDARVRYLQRVPIFSGFDEADLRGVVKLSKIVETPAGAVVTEIGQPGDSFFVLIDGTVAVRTPLGAGAELHPGDFFGEMSLLDGEPRSATIVAATPLRLLVVERAQFWTLLNETPELVTRILTTLSRRVRRLEQTVDAIRRGTQPG
jgi:CRP-like cAMP-binding protein